MTQLVYEKKVDTLSNFELKKLFIVDQIKSFFKLLKDLFNYFEGLRKSVDIGIASGEDLTVDLAGIVSTFFVDQLGQTVSKFDKVSTTFIEAQLGQKFIRFQTLFQCWHSSLDPQINWISPWLDWETVHFETLIREFLSSKLDNVANIFSLTS